MGATLIIIGNGFDKAHGLETSYQDFVRYIFDNYNQNEEKFSVLFKKNNAYPSNINYNQFFDSNIKVNLSKLEFINILFRETVLKKNTENWFDFETKYFELLKERNNDKEYQFLNNELITIRNLFLEYLGEIQKKFTHSGCFEYLFEIIDEAHKEHPKMIVNFNYTNTANKYAHLLSHHKLVHIHGELDSKVNLPLFGYSVFDDEDKKVQRKDGLEIRRHIKNVHYLSSNYFNDVIQFLEQNTEITTYVLGHGCGKSDFYLLNEIFNHKNVSILHLMHKDQLDFDTKIANIDQIGSTMKYPQRIKSRLDSIVIPQISEKNDNEFKLRIKKKLLS